MAQQYARFWGLVKDGLLGPRQVRELADKLGLRPTKQRGQNFVIDPNTVRSIVEKARVGPDDVVLEVGPGLGSLTLALLPRVQRVIAVEIDPILANALPETVATYQPDSADRLTVITADALDVCELGTLPTAMVANLPYNVAVPVLLHLLEHFDSIHLGLVMVQAEVADRLAAAPGSRVYGVPSVKMAWYASTQRAGRVSAQVFWPAPRVELGLVAFQHRPPPEEGATRQQTFAVVDAAFAQRRKTLRAALAPWAGSPHRAEETLILAGIDPSARGEQLGVTEFARIAAAARLL